jgi:hypothetical protein
MFVRAGGEIQIIEIHVPSHPTFVHFLAWMTCQTFMGRICFPPMGVGFAVGHHEMVQAYGDGSQCHGRLSLASGGIGSIAFLATPLVKQVELR